MLNISLQDNNYNLSVPYSKDKMFKKNYSAQSHLLLTPEHENNSKKQGCTAYLYFVVYFNMRYRFKKYNIKPRYGSTATRIILCCLSKSPSKSFEGCLNDVVRILSSKLQTKIEHQTQEHNTRNKKKGNARAP